MTEPPPQPAPAPDDLLQIWVQYFSPTDYPGQHVARLYRLDARGRSIPTDRVFTASTCLLVEDHMVNLGLHFIARHESDEPHIVGTWI